MLVATTSIIKSPKSQQPHDRQADSCCGGKPFNATIHQCCPDGKVVSKLKHKCCMDGTHVPKDSLWFVHYFFI